jgi:hypothetical protein
MAPPFPCAAPLCASCQFLNLSGNAISAQGCAAVAEVLGANGSIYALSLAGCPVRDEGAIALAEALKSNIALFKLDLSNTQVAGAARKQRAAVVPGAMPPITFANLIRRGT